MKIKVKNLGVLKQVEQIRVYIAEEAPILLDGKKRKTKCQTFDNITVNKTTTRPRRNQERSSSTEIHDSPEKMLKISSLNSLQFGQLI